MQAFVYEQFPMRVRFGEGAVAELAAEARLAGIRRAMVLSTPEQRPQALMATDLLGELSCAVFDGATMHVPSTVVDRAEALAASAGIDGIVAIGGGSTLGLAKALALRGSYVVIAVPTTYAGSEMTDIYGISQDGRKVTGRDRRVRPQVVVYDPELTDTLPIGLSVTSGFNAMAHAAEALYAPDTNPIVGLMAQEAVSAMARGLQGLAGPHKVPGARADCLYAAWLAGAALDVFEREPYAPAAGRDLRRLANVIMTPHISSSTREACARMASRALENIRLAEAGRHGEMDLLNREVLGKLGLGR